MNAASHPPHRRDQRGLVVLDAAGQSALHRVSGLAHLLDEGSLLIANDAATLPASLRGRVAEDELQLEARLARHHDDGTWTAILLASGSWRQPTEARTQLPQLFAGTHLEFGSLRAEIVHVDEENHRWVRLRFEGDEASFWAGLYRDGRVIQYSYLDDDLALWSPQTLFAGRPWALEMPSAGHPLSAELLVQMRARGIEVQTLTHAAGISSTGDAELDRRLPLPERYDFHARPSRPSPAPAPRAGLSWPWEPPSCAPWSRLRSHVDPVTACAAEQAWPPCDLVRAPGCEPWTPS